ncbi:MAG TPA: ABC transporter substrate-binding protein [Actinomycetota bacterium]
MREERRVVTAVFADLVGSTALGERLDPEELKLVVGEAVSRMVVAVEAFDGHVKDLAGDGVLAIFGAPTSHEDDAERAVRAGLRIVEEIAAFGLEIERSWGVAEVDVRVGIETGPVVTGAIGGGSRVEYSALGDAVNTASRLQGQAVPGTVLVGAETHRSVADAFAWGPVRELTLKGKGSPVEAYPVAGVAGASPGPPRGRRVPMIGREAELTLADSLVEGAVLGGSGAILYLSGEPGIGKTRMMQELRELVRGAQPAHGRSLWLEGRCVSYGESMSYWPFRDLLRSWLGVAPDDPDLRVTIALRRAVDRLFGARAGELTPYLGALLELSFGPDADAKLAELSPEAAQFRTFEVVRHLIERLAEDGPVVMAFEDLHWADATSLLLLEQLVSDTEALPLLIVCSGRPERDHPWWRLKDETARRLPHRFRAIALESLPDDSGSELLHALVGYDTLPTSTAERVLASADGNPFFLEEIVRSLQDAGALVATDEGLRFDHEVDVEIPPTVEKVILARIDRLEPSPRQTLLAASVLGRRFSLSLLEAVAGDAGIRGALSELMRLDFVREGRRWPEPEFRFKHALIQEAAYRTLVKDDRARLHRKAAESLEAQRGEGSRELAGLLAHHWLGAADEDKAVRYLTLAGDRARQEYALDEAVAYYRELLPLLERRGEEHAIALGLFKLALALHMALRFSEADATYQRAFEHWTPPTPVDAEASVRFASSFLPNDPDPRSAIAWPNIQLCMQLFDRLVEQWPERTIVPSLAERWDISADGLRYVFHLREGLRWSDGTPLTAGDVEFGIKRVLDPSAPGSSVAVYFVLEHGQERYLGSPDEDRIGVRALDERTVEFRLAAPAPYFLSVMNRPDGGPQPRHAIEADPGGWTRTGSQVVSGAFRLAERDDDRVLLERRDDYGGSRAGNVSRVEILRSSLGEAVEAFKEGELDLVTVRYTPRMADVAPVDIADARLGPAAWSGYLAFDHASGPTADVDLRLALAHAVDRDRLAEAVPINLVVATGGIVPPALQGHTPDVSLRFEPDRAREALLRSGFAGPIAVACLDEDEVLLEPIVGSWREVLGLEVEMRVWDRASIASLPPLRDVAPIYLTGWLPGYADPEYFLRLLFQSDSRTNEGGFASESFDLLIERARQERSDRSRLELFHEADRMAVVDRVAVIPVVYGRSMALVSPRVQGWWEFGKSSANFAELNVDR